MPSLASGDSLHLSELHDALDDLTEPSGDDLDVFLDAKEQPGLPPLSRHSDRCMWGDPAACCEGWGTAWCRLEMSYSSLAC